ncbi:MAG: baseplate assembly protein, partial [Pseudomonadota bacterium]|nr:baseplate assembly protein [Pseudomonadota bacterium]
MQEFLNSIKWLANSLDRQAGQPRIGVVQSINPNDHTARVLIQPSATLSGWMPVAAQWIGNGWGMVCLPSPGDQVVVVPHDGDADNGIIIGRVYAPQGGVLPPPAPVGEFWLVHKAGAYIKLLNDGTIASNATWYHTGDLHVTGAVIAGFGSGD